MKKTIDISNYNDFLDAGFKECHKCGWAFDPQYFDDHKCSDNQPIHNHISPEYSNKCQACKELRELQKINKKLKQAEKTDI